MYVCMYMYMFVCLFVLLGEGNLEISSLNTKLPFWTLVGGYLASIPCTPIISLFSP